MKIKIIDMADVVKTKKKQKYNFSRDTIAKKLGIRGTKVGKYEIISENHLTKD